MTQVKTYRVYGKMLISHDKMPTWQKFVKEVRGLSESEAIEKIYSLLGSSHKLKRHHIEIERVEEIPAEAARTPTIKQIVSLERIVKK